MSCKATGLRPAAAGDSGVPASLTRLVARTTRALADRVRPDGTLWDPDAGAPTAPDHYAATFAALAIAVADPGDPRWPALLHAWRRLGRRIRGHAPFNRLALLLLFEHRERLGLGGEPWPGSDAGAKIAREPWLALCEPARHYPSNNWVLLARACGLLEETMAGTPPDAAARRFDGDARRWATAAGGFIDFPEKALDAVAVPTCYHAKFVTLLALVVRFAPGSEREGLLDRATRWLVAFTDAANGLVGGYGRSSHSLFGAACALFVYLDAMQRARDPSERDAHARRVDALCARLEAGRREDGLLSLTPNPQTGWRGGWDRYMHLSVYNAYAAGLLAWLAAASPATPAARNASGAASPEGSRPPALFRDSAAGVLASRGSRAAVFLSLGGGPVQDFRPDEVDLRYAGLQPFHLRCDGRPAVAPPLRVGREDLLRAPQLAGWVPIFRFRGSLYGLARFDAVEVHESGERLLALGWGSPVRLHDAPRRRGGASWWLDQLDRRLRRRRSCRRRALAPAPLAGHAAVCAFAFDGQSGAWGAATVLRGRPSESVFLNPWGHSWLAGGDGRARVPAAGTAVIRRVGALPASLPAARGACGEPAPWPALDTAYVVVAGPAVARGEDAEQGGGASPALLRVDLEGDRVVTPWTSRPLSSGAAPNGTCLQSPLAPE